MARRVTIKDVAAAAGVSVAAASMALRDTGRLSDATRAQVKEAAATLGYRANPHARSLRSGESRVLALTMPQLRPVPGAVGQVEYFAHLVAAAVAAALEQDRALVVVPPTVLALDRLPVDGVVVVDPIAHDPLLVDLMGRGVPVVTVGRPLDRPDGTYAVVDTDYAAGTREVLDHLTARGARRPALLACDLPDSFHADSLAAYRAWCAEHGVPAVVRTAPRPLLRPVVPAVEELLDADPAIDAVYATIDHLGRAVLDVAARRGLRVPDDLRVATCSDSEVARGSDPPLTVVEDRPQDVGRAAVAALLRTIAGPGTPPVTMVPPSLTVRASSLAAPAGHAG